MSTSGMAVVSASLGPTALTQGGTLVVGAGMEQLARGMVVGTATEIEGKLYRDPVGWYKSRYRNRV